MNCFIFEMLGQQGRGELSWSLLVSLLRLDLPVRKWSNMGDQSTQAETLDR